MDILELLKFIGGSGLLIAGLTYLAKRFIDKSLDIAIERYKSTLQRELESYKHNLTQQTERLKFELNKLSLEHQSKFNALYQERGSIIKETYSQILSIEVELLKLTTLYQGPEWKETKNNFALKELIIQFEKSFETKRLYFNKEMCDNIELLIERIESINVKMYQAKLQAETNAKLETRNTLLTGVERQKPHETWRSLEAEAKNEIKTLRRALERDFAKLIGVE